MKRKHPLRRIMIGVAATASGVVLLLALKQPGGTPLAGAGTGTQAGTGVAAAVGGAAGATGGQTVLGNAVDTQYGPVQVQITLEGGKIIKAEAVQAPNSDARSQSVTADAVPKLNQAAVAAQSAQVDTVSGASYTSKGYQESLQSALDKAGTGGGADTETPPAQGDGANGDATGGAEAGADADAGAGAGTDAGGATGGSTGDASGDAPATPPETGPRTVLGNAVNTQYGTVQVQITVEGGRITKADAVQAPNGDARSQSVSADAVPKLNQAAVTAQSAQVDTVSGASYTSKGYQESLQSALDKAGN
ncbi:FMN-binding protein [Streptomyces paludis]|uniref:FMN-binding protein n=1 Tax=Streptomyces paludis TaxID=2282738 RepID=A0A345I059_9ACTN|nr:FMN-binding protein [Streptomyces paludis]AXG82333.1 FMN-binding protein [Streptomyces paludis]